MKIYFSAAQIKKVLFLLAFFSLVLITTGQNSEEKQPAKKGLGSKLKEIKIPEGIVPKIPGTTKSSSKENTQEDDEQEQTDEPEQFDEDEDDADKMMEKMIRQLGHDPEKVNQMMNEEGADSDPRAIPESNQKVLASIKLTPRNESELVSYLKTFDSGAEKAISPEAGKEASPHLNKGQKTKEAAYMLWMAGKQEAAAYLMLKAAVADPKDELLLGNLGSVITISGYAEKSIPILDYLKNQNPQSSIANNNLGQAWLSLGQVAKAKPLLEQAVGKFEQHPEANRSLARIAQKEGNVAQAKTYLENALKGGFSQESYYELRDLTGKRSKGMVESIRTNHKRYFKDIAVTKRFSMPSVPSSVEQAIGREQEIEDFFKGIEMTVADIHSKIPAGTDKIYDNQQEISMQMAANIKKMNSLDAVKKQYELFVQIWNPFKLQAQEMLNTEIDDSYASSFRKRMGQLDESRDMKMREMNESLSADYRKIQEMEKKLSKMETGEGESPEVAQLENQLCAQKKYLQELEFSLRSAINNAYVQEMESLAFQYLQEFTYWYTLYFLPQSPTENSYRLYADYLSTLLKLKNVYPYPVPQPYTGNGCELKLLELVTPKGKMSVWEDTHCATYWDRDLYFIQSKFTCKELTLKGKVEGIEIGIGQKYDPSTLETIEHSILFGAGVGKKVGDVGKNLSINMGADAVTTIKFDKDFNIKDVIVQLSAGAEMGMRVPTSIDPNDSGLDIRQAASVGVSGGVEVSILSGFRGIAPSVSSVGNIFNR